MASTYDEAGVDLDAADEVVERISDAVQSTWGPDVVGAFGGFAGGIEMPTGYRNPVLMMSTDGVGTKLDIARRAQSFDGVGADLVAMCVDDLAAAGASPLAFTDYIAVGSIQPDREAAIVRSVATACAAAGVALLGGETAEHPGTMPSHAIDIAGTALGVAERDGIVTGAGIAPGDVVIGVPSPNLRSNGFSLVRSVLDDLDLNAPFPGETRSAAEVLLEPSVIYAPAVVAAIGVGGVHGLAHVTGGGLAGNVRRVLPDSVSIEIDAQTWDVPNVFAVVQDRGGVATEEMRTVFNMGIGFVLAVESDRSAEVCGVFASHGHAARPIGRVVAGDRTITYV